MSRVDGSVRVNMKTWLLAARRLSFENTPKRSCRVLGKEGPWGNTSIVGQNYLRAIFVKDMNRDLIEKVAILSINERVCSIANDGLGGQHEYVGEFFYRDFDASALAWAKSPHKKGGSILLIRARLVKERYKKVKRPARRIDRVGEVSNLKLLVIGRP